MSGLEWVAAAVFAILLISSMQVVLRQLDKQGKKQEEIIALMKEIRDELKKNR
ncbi:hypothetical protein [Brevibacillus migulae]|uniref:hypothetical protein n=1 Tax=Brevibacillus migulae TaxID=1644114 RepID=UPI00143120EC|nr:hypothetical protein [Brevibacillus migulae]